MHSKELLANGLQLLPSVPFDIDDTIESCFQLDPVALFSDQGYPMISSIPSEHTQALSCPLGEVVSIKRLGSFRWILLWYPVRIKYFCRPNRLQPYKSTLDMLLLLSSRGTEAIATVSEGQGPIAQHS